MNILGNLTLSKMQDTYQGEGSPWGDGCSSKDICPGSREKLFLFILSQLPADCLRLETEEPSLTRKGWICLRHHPVPATRLLPLFVI